MTVVSLEYFLSILLTTLAFGAEEIEFEACLTGCQHRYPLRASGSVGPERLDTTLGSGVEESQCRPVPVIKATIKALSLQIPGLTSQDTPFGIDNWGLPGSVRRLNPLWMREPKNCAMSYIDRHINESSSHMLERGRYDDAMMTPMTRKRRLRHKAEAPTEKTQKL